MKEEIYNILEAYINDDMSPDDRQSFELRLAQEDDLRKAYDSYKATHEGIQISSLQQNLNMLKDLESEISTRIIPLNAKKTNSRSRFSLLRIAASIVILLGLGWWLSNISNSSVDHNELFAEHFTVTEAPAMGTSRGDADPIRDCYEAYSSANWATAIPCLTELAKTSDMHHYYLGIAYLANDNAEKAIAAFDNLGDFPIPEMNEDLIWYKGLGYLRLGDIDKLKELWDGINEDKYGKSIQEILSKTI